MQIITLENILLDQNFARNWQEGRMFAKLATHGV